MPRNPPEDCLEEVVQRLLQSQCEPVPRHLERGPRPVLPPFLWKGILSQALKPG